MIDNGTPIYNNKTFENFNENENNQRVLKEAKVFAEIPSYYKMLYIFGEAGTGKSHLLNAIGLKMLQDNPNIRIIKTTSEEILKKFIFAIKKDTIKEFQNIYADADIVLIDDVDKIKGKLNSQKEVAYLINKLLKAEKRIAVAGRISPEVMLTGEYDIDFVNVMRSQYSIGTESLFGAAEYNHQRTLIRDICVILDKYLYKYHIENDVVGRRYNIVVPFVNDHKLFINCNPSSEKAIIRLPIEIEPHIMNAKKERLLDACNIISRVWYLNAKMFQDDGVLTVSYEIPPRVGDAMEHIIMEVLYYFEHYLDFELIDKAVNADEDLYAYAERKMDEGIKQSLNKKEK